MKSTFTHPIDHYLENPEAPFAEAGLIAWATMKAKRDAKSSGAASLVYKGLFDNDEMLKRALSDPDLKRDLIQLIVDMPR